jgi:hypothetical protein
MWKQTVWATALAMLGLAGLALYFVTQPIPDYDAVGWLFAFMVLLPLALGACYLIRRLIEALSD